MSRRAHASTKVGLSYSNVTFLSAAETQAILKYIRECSGQWPRSWNQLHNSTEWTHIGVLEKKHDDQEAVLARLSTVAEQVARAACDGAVWAAFWRTHGPKLRNQSSRQLWECLQQQTPAAPFAAAIALHLHPDDLVTKICKPVCVVRISPPRPQCPPV